MFHSIIRKIPEYTDNEQVSRFSKEQIRFPGICYITSVHTGNQSLGT